ncbi:hypothetical protein H6227_002576, partial [Enterococcus faecalis]|nr:hypothetical protein [Enterococcus faecalis]
AATGTMSLDSSTFSLKSGSRITGTVAGDITKVKLVLNGKEQKTVNVSNQAFSYYAKELVTNGELKSVNDSVEMVGMDNNLKELARQKVTIID